MRFRLTTKPPLPLLKAWYALSPSPGLDITSLKDQLCSCLPLLKQHNVSPDTILLSIDDFELLDDSALDVIKENDLVCISATPSSIASHKRRAISSSPVPRKRWKSAHLPPQKPIVQRETKRTASSSSSSTTSVSDSESSSDSSETSSSSSSDTTSDSDSDSAIETLSSNLPSNGLKSRSGRQAKVTSVIKSNHVRTITVPPGAGKSATHNRNARRRVKRFYDKLESDGKQLSEKSLAVDSPNAIPLGNQRISAAQSQGPHIVSTACESGHILEHPVPPPGPAFSHATVEAEQASSTLKNKNKKRGFRRDMSGITPQRIVFSTDERADAEREATVQEFSSYDATASTSNSIQGLTPTEKQDKGLLPPNMFVTSVEVEGGRWDRKNKKKQRDLYGYHTSSRITGNVGMGGAWPDEGGAVDADANGETLLDYGDADEAPTKTSVAGPLTIVDWGCIDSKWDLFRDVDDISSLSPGSLVGWKELAINPATFTPEMLARVARVKKLDTENLSTITLLTIQRPGEDEIAFGCNGIPSDGKLAKEDEAAADEEVREMTFKDAMMLKLRLVVV